MSHLFGEQPNMNPDTLAAMQSAQEAVTRLVGTCQKESQLYKQNPRAVAQVSRNSKWLLNAIALLQRELENPCNKENVQ